MRIFYKALILLVFIIFTLTGVLFGANVGVNYSHIVLAVYYISSPLFIGLLTYYLIRSKTFKPRLMHLGILALSMCYSSVIGGGYIYLVNSIGLHKPVEVSGRITSKNQYDYRKPTFYITFLNGSSGEPLEIEITSDTYNQLAVGDIYTETMYLGSLGLLYRQKT